MIKLNAAIATIRILLRPNARYAGKHVTKNVWNLMSANRRIWTSRMQLNRNMLDEITYEQEEYEGIGLLETYTRQSQLEIPNIMKQLRWGGLS